MNYLLSNIARSCVLNKNSINILYVPTLSCIDSIVSSIPGTNILRPNTYWSGDIQGILCDSIKNIDYKYMLETYQCNVLEINKEHQQKINNVSCLDININNLNIKIPNKQKDKKLLYILDNDKSKSTIIIRYLDSLSIGYTVLQPSDFLDMNIWTLSDTISKFEFVLDNTSTNNLILASKLGLVPLTFIKDLIGDHKEINLVSEHNFLNTVSCKVSSTKDYSVDNTMEFLNNISSNIKYLLGVPFIL